jgi:hypothetical protein
MKDNRRRILFAILTIALVCGLVSLPFFISAPVSASTTLTLHAGSGDSTGNSSPYFSGTSTSLQAGKSTTYAIKSWIPFANATVAQASSITSATLKLTASTSRSETTVKLLFGCEAADNANTAPTDWTTLNAKTMSAATTADNNVAAWTAGTEYTFNITSCVQEIVNRAGFASGNTISILIFDNGSTNDARRNIAAEENTSYTEPVLVIVYDEPTATSTVTSSITNTASLTSTVTSSVTVTPSITVTPSKTFTPSHTVTQSLTPSETFTPSKTPTETLTPSETPTHTLTPSETFTPSKTPTHTVTQSLTPSETPTITDTPTETSTPSITFTPTITDTPTETLTPTATRTTMPAAMITGTYEAALLYYSGIAVDSQPTVIVFAILCLLVILIPVGILVFRLGKGRQ